MKKTIEQRLLSARPERLHGNAEFLTSTMDIILTAQANETFKQKKRKTGITKKERFMLKLKHIARILLIGGVVFAIGGAAYATTSGIIKWQYNPIPRCVSEPEACVKPSPAVFVGKDEKLPVPTDWMIKQWRISAKNTSPNHLQYNVGSGNKIFFTSADLSSAQQNCDLTKSQNGPGGGGSFWITRYAADGVMDTSPLTVKAQAALFDRDGHKDWYKKVGNYYYFFGTPQTACTAVFGRPATDADNAAGALYSKTIQALTDLLASFTAE